MTGKSQTNVVPTAKAAIMASILSAMLALAGCNNNDANSSQNDTVNTGSVSILTSPSSAGSGLAFELTVLSDFTNADGYARIDKLPPGERLIFNVGRQDFALQTFVTGLNERESQGYIPVDLLALTGEAAQVTDFDVATGGTFTKGDAKIIVPVNALRRNDGEPITRGMRSFLTPIDLADKSKKYLPADWLSDDDAHQPLEAFAAMHVQLEEQEPVPAQTTTLTYRLGLNDIASLKPKETMSVAIPVTTPNPPQTVDLYRFNINNAYWTKLDTALTLNADKTAYIGTTNQTGYLAAMRPVTDTVKISGCVERQLGTTVTKAERSLVSMYGSSYTGYDQTLTDTQGRFSLTAKRGASVTLAAQVDQFRQTGIQLDNLTTDTVINDGNCLRIDTSGSESNVQGKLSWQGKSDYDINVLLPNGTLMYYDNRILANAAGPAGVAVEIKENANGNSEDIAYSALMVGQHLLTVNNFSRQFSPSISGANTNFVFNGQSFSAANIAGEVTQRDSKLVDRRTNVWLAAIMTVEDDCSISVKSPSDVSVSQDSRLQYKSWLTDTELRDKQVFVGTTERFKSEGAVFCKKPVETP